MGTIEHERSETRVKEVTQFGLVELFEGALAL